MNTTDITYSIILILTFINAILLLFTIAILAANSDLKTIIKELKRQLNKELI